MKNGQTLGSYISEDISHIEPMLPKLGVSVRYVQIQACCESSLYMSGAMGVGVGVSE